jgi:hypothetical protein
MSETVEILSDYFSTISDFILIGEGNLALTMFGNTYLLSNIMLLALNNMLSDTSYG